MTKSELIDQLYLSSDFSQEDATAAVNTIIDTMQAAIGRGERVEIRGFGVFSLHERKARAGRNPKTGESVDIPAKYVIHFKPGKELRERVDSRELLRIKGTQHLIVSVGTKGWQDCITLTACKV